MNKKETIRNIRMVRDYFEMVLESGCDETIAAIYTNAKRACENAIDYIEGAQEGIRWIKITTAPLDEKETRAMKDFIGTALLDEEDLWKYSCELPEDKEEVLVTTKNGFVVMTQFFYSEGNASWFDGFEERDSAIAWAHLPEPYSGGNKP